MINTLDDYVWRSLPEYGDFATNPNLRKKVDDNGAFLPFRGNTVVFLLDDAVKAVLRGLQRELYTAAGDLLAQPLDASTFHMTLHDLANGPASQRDLEQWMAWTEENARSVISGWQDRRPLRMRATWMFNMVNTSIVLGLAPGDGESWQRLDELYTALEGVVSLGYGLSPHITLGYYRPGVYSQKEIGRLRDALRPVELELTLRMEDLVLQNFEDMNGYSTIWPK